MKTAEYILDAYRTERISHVFLVPGGLIDPFLPAFSSKEGITPIVAAHEGGAACMADGYARASGRFGACFAIGGPGITNMVTAIVAARADGSPVIVITGEVPTDWEGRGGFQDASAAALDDTGMLRPLVLSSLTVENVHLLNHHLRSAMTHMLAGAQGPVHLSIPTDIQRADVLHPWEKLDDSLSAPRFADHDAIERLWGILVSEPPAKAPSHILLLVGAGVEKSGASALLTSFAERFELPVATTLRAKGVFPEDHRLSLGVFGYAGHRPAIETILSGEVEVLIVLGSGLNQRDTLFWDCKMLPGKALVHVDIEPQVIGRTWHTEVPLVGDCGTVLRQLLESDPARLAALAASNPQRRAWIGKIASRGPRHYDLENTRSDLVPIHPARVIAEMRRLMPRDSVLVVDSGAHRAFCGHYWQAFEGRAYISATNLGPMGWAIPAGIGAKLARPNRPLAVVTGDGCMLMHGMEVQTAARYKVPVLFVVMNNGALGNVWLRAVQDGPATAALTELPVHDWAGFARSLGLAAETIRTPDEIEPAIRKALQTDAPYLLDVRCGREYRTPVTPFNQAKKEWHDDD
jgi:acetolactate synthase-1/2/3 large subunit